MELLRRHLVVVTVFCLLMVVAVRSTSAAQAPVSITDLGGLIPGGFSDAYAVNDTGLVAGVANVDPTSNIVHATVWIDGVPRDLGTLCSAPCPFQARSSATDVNERGQVVGNSEIADGNSRGFIWEQGKGMRALPPLDGDSPLWRSASTIRARRSATRELR
jgi:probable HAF family extracellular repeat protein